MIKSSENSERNISPNLQTIAYNPQKMTRKTLKIYEN